MSEPFGQERAKLELAALVAVLDPVLVPHGFTFVPGDTGVSSGGSFSNGHYRHATVEIGLIYRGPDLGCPDYTSGHVGVGHNSLMRELGRAEDCALWFDDSIDRWCLVARRGMTVVDALVADLTTIVLPCLLLTPKTWAAALAQAQERRILRFTRL
jgi:hypothetical protein